MLFNLFRLLFGQLCFLNCSFLMMPFDQLCSLNDFLLDSLSGQLYQLEAFSCQCFLVFLKSFLDSIAFQMVHFCQCYLINFAILIVFCLVLSTQICLLEAFFCQCFLIFLVSSVFRTVFFYTLGNFFFQIEVIRIDCIYRSR